MTAEPFIQLRNVRKVYRSGGAEFLAEHTILLGIDDDQAVRRLDRAGV